MYKNTNTVPILSLSPQITRGIYINLYEYLYIKCIFTQFQTDFQYINIKKKHKDEYFLFMPAFLNHHYPKIILNNVTTTIIPPNTIR